MNKKILIILYKKHTSIGGIESYNSNLIDIIINNYNDIEIHEVIVDQLCEDTQENYQNKIKYFYSKKSESSSYFRKVKEARIFINKITKKNSYDLIIDSTSFFYRKLSKLDNYFWVQQFDYDTYVTKLNIKNPFIRFLNLFVTKILFGIKNPFKNNKNIVLFDENTKIKLENLNSKLKKVNKYIIPISAKNQFIDSEDNLIKNRNRIIYLGRIDEKQKNISSLLKINETLKLIDFYGPINDSKENKYINTIMLNNDSYKGSVNFMEKFMTIKKYKFLIMLSNYEGFPNVIVEALSVGTPVIVRNTFLAANYLCNQRTGILIDKNKDEKEIINIIKNAYNLGNNEYYALCKSSKEFYDKNLSFELFIKKWKVILNEFLIKGK